MQAEAKRPSKARSSKGLLHHRHVEQTLLRFGDYDGAIAVREVADQLEAVELEATREAFEADTALKAQNLRQRQQTELEALKLRITRGRDELLLAQRTDVDRLGQRFKNLQAELSNLQKIEMAQLENFLVRMARAAAQGGRLPWAGSEIRRPFSAAGTAGRGKEESRAPDVRPGPVRHHDPERVRLRPRHRPHRKEGGDRGPLESSGCMYATGGRLPCRKFLLAGSVHLTLVAALFRVLPRGTRMEGSDPLDMVSANQSRLSACDAHGHDFSEVRSPN